MSFLYTRAALKVVPLILLSWPTILQADAYGMAVEAEPSSVPKCTANGGDHLEK